MTTHYYTLFSTKHNFSQGNHQGNWIKRARLLCPCTNKWSRLDEFFSRQSVYISCEPIVFISVRLYGGIKMNCINLRQNLIKVQSNSNLSCLIRVQLAYSLQITCQSLADRLGSGSPGSTDGRHLGLSIWVQLHYWVSGLQEYKVITTWFIVTQLVPLLASLNWPP